MVNRSPSLPAIISGTHRPIRFARDRHRQIMLRAALAVALDQHMARGTHLLCSRRVMPLRRRSQPLRTLLDRSRPRPAASARPACRRAARYGKTCRNVEAAFLDDLSELANIASVSVGKPAMMSAPKTISGRRRRTCVAERDRVVARMPALHALQDHVVAGLQRQMQMRHQPRLVGDGVEQIGVGLDRIDGGDAAGASAPAPARKISSPVCRASARPAGRRRSR